MNRKNQQSFEERWDIITPQGIENFEINVREINKKEPEHYDESPEPWLRLKGYKKKFEYIMNHDYWLEYGLTS